MYDICSPLVLGELMEPTKIVDRWPRFSIFSLNSVYSSCDSKIRIGMFRILECASRNAIELI